MCSGVHGSWLGEFWRELFFNSDVSSLELILSIVVSRPCQAVLGDYRGAILESPGSWIQPDVMAQYVLEGGHSGWLSQILTASAFARWPPPPPPPSQESRSSSKAGNSPAATYWHQGPGLGLGLSHLFNIWMKGRKDGESIFVHYKAYLTATPNWREGNLENKQLESWDSS